MKIKKWFINLMIMAVTISNLSFSTIKAETYPIPNGPEIVGTGAKIDWTNLNGDWSTAWWPAIQKVTVAGSIGFCVEPTTIGLTGPYHSSQNDWDQLTQRKMSRIVYYGWDESSKTDTDYAVTQYMLWESLGATISFNGAFGSIYPSLKASVQNKINSHGTKPSFGHEQFEINAGDTISLIDSNDVLSKFDIVSAIEGTEVKINGNNLVISTSMSSPDSFNIDLQQEAKDYVGSTIVYRSSANNGQDVGVFKVKDPNQQSLTIKVNKFGSLKLAKQDEDGTYVANTTFNLSYNSDMSDPIGMYTTGNDGSITIEDLLPKTVYIQEVVVPSHLVLDHTVYSMTIKPNDTVTYTAKNSWAKGKVKLRKVDSENGNQVADATYAIFDQNGQELQKLVTTATGFVESGYLRFGDYTVKEVIAPEGYVLNDTVYPVKISENEQRIEVTGEDTAIKGYLQVIKKDADTGAVIVKSHTVFQIYQKDGTFVGEITTDNDGKATTELLRYGEYYIVEKTAPNGYVHSDEKIYYNIIEDGKTYVSQLSNKRVRAEVSIEKEDDKIGSLSQGEATLEGAVYGLFARESIVDPANGSIRYHKGAKVAELKTNEEAKAVASDLYLGKYYLKEVQPSEGYTLDQTEYDVLLAYEGQTVALVKKKQVVKERVIAQAFSIIKISDNDSGEVDLLKGVEFTIKSKKDIDAFGDWDKAPIAKNAEGKMAAKLITDEKGYAASEELPFGTYVVRETKTPEHHYSIPDFTVVIDEDSRNPQIWRVFNDEKFKAVVGIVKQDEETLETIALAGAEFKIKNLDKNEYVGSWVWNPLPHYVDRWTTDESGMVMSDDVLDPGNYQLEEVKAPEGYLLNQEPIKFTVGSNVAYETLPDGTTPLITVKMKDQSVKGSIRVLKEGDVLEGAEKLEDGYRFLYKKRNLKDAVFEIYAKEDIDAADHQGKLLYHKDELIETIRSDETGIASSKLLPLGTYYVKEKLAPGGFVESDEIKEVKLVYQDQETPVVFSNTTFVNEKQAVAVIAHKLDQDSATPIKQAEFSLFANRDVYNYDGEVIVKEGELLQAVETKEDGNAEFSIDLPNDWTPEYATMPIDELDEEDMTAYNGEIVGDIKLYHNPNSLFYVKETRYPLGYVSDIDTRYYIDTTYTSQEERVLSFAFTKYNKKTEMAFLKTDVNNQPLPGSTLAVFDENQQLVEQWVSTIEPHVIAGLLIGNTYTLKELQPTAGFTKADDITFEVMDQMEVQKIVMMNKPTELTIEKMDKESILPLAGATLAVYDSKGELLEEWMSTLIPHRIRHLVEGESYVVRELSAPLGYGIMKDYQFVMKEGMQIVIENEKIKKDVTILKYDQDDNQKVLAHAIFALYEDEACLHELQRVESDQEGKATFTSLLCGTYYIKELESPRGYELSTEVKKVVVDETEQSVLVTWENKRKVEKRTVIVHSGDATNVIGYSVLMIGSFGIVFLLFMRKKRKNG